MISDLFASSPSRYDRWYDRNPDLYRSELAALRRTEPDFSAGLEVGVGTGRFASPLGLSWGIDPVREMLDLARRRGCRVLQGTGESLPFADGVFQRVLMVTALCFFRDPAQAVVEAFRVLRPGGRLVLGIIDPESELGRTARKRKDPDSFYAAARFISVAEALALLPEAARGGPKIFQALFPEERAGENAPAVERGHGRGAFVVISAAKPAPDRIGTTENDTE